MRTSDASAHARAMARHRRSMKRGETGRAVMDCLFAEHARLGTALLLITHDAELAARCEREIILADGRIVAERQTAPRRRAL